MMLQKKSSKLLPKFPSKKTKRKRTVPLFSKSKAKSESTSHQVKKPDRRRRNRIQKISLLFIPFSIIISAICIFVIFFLLQDLNSTKQLISPVTVPFVNNSDDGNYEANLEKALKKEGIDYADIYVLQDGSCIIKLTDESLVIISSQKDINREISSLQFILQRLTMEGKEFTKLDLRFDKPVITFK